MKAMILAAGRGERLRPLTDTLPKPLVHANGKPLIEYHLEKLAKIGITEVVINQAWLGHMLPEQLGNGERWGIEIHYSQENEALETAGGIKKALPLLGDEPFLLLNGDIYIDQLPDVFSALTTVETENLDGFIWLVDNPEHNLKGDFAFASKGSTKHAGDLSLNGQPCFTYSGMGIFSPKMFADLPQGSQPLGPLLRQSIVQAQTFGCHFTHFWCDVGTIERLKMLNHRLLSQTSKS
ncbi:N-acetylmuramate alpha-1-phosphate uridylyltransferase MurU [Shewanella gaetbuli]|uniref:Nucleotidyltransferase family protein n=1 Tax=Shewanella gaetbuli TaxID=220752 RepID=A0A9X2CKR4_9GAMM|nr:nucleotidyltransferase family protein [Shewanella gaetbuli]MCL1141905.1 nucleotidyltransferase family protein [Shewanella gaetbuli]